MTAWSEALLMMSMSLTELKLSQAHIKERDQQSRVAQRCHSNALMPQTLLHQHQLFLLGVLTIRGVSAGEVGAVARKRCLYTGNGRWVAWARWRGSNLFVPIAWAYLNSFLGSGLNGL